MASTGVAALDRLLGEGYPNKSAILVVSSPGKGKEVVAYRFTSSGLSHGDYCVYVTSSSVREILQDFGGCGISVPTGGPPLWIAREGGEFNYDESDLAALSFNLKEAIRRCGDRRIRVVLDVVSPLLMLNRPETVYRFLSQLLDEVKRHDSVLLATIDSGMHPPEVLAAMEQLFDGVMQFSQSNERYRGVDLEVRKMRGVPQQLTLPWEMGSSEGERRLAAIMFTDMVGYTALTQNDESGAMELLAEQRKIVRPLFPKHGGREVKTIGDAFLVEFGSALEAVRCAFDIQQTLHELDSDRPPMRRFQLRVGVHLGDVIYEQNDVYGDAVNIASRIESLASPGGVCVTEQVFDQIKNKFEFPFQSLGKRELKNVGEPLEVYQVVMPWDRGSTDRPKLDPNRIAVLPFVNMGPDPRDDYIADGLTEEVISSMAWFDGVYMVSRTSVMKYKGSSKGTSEIASELGAGTIIEGSIRKAGDKVRITVQLIDAVKDQHRWVQSWDRHIQDIFEIQSDISRRIATSLKVKLTVPVSVNASSTAPPKNPSPLKAPKICRRCGGSIPEDAVFCRHCGMRLRNE